MALFDALHASIYIFFHLFFMCCREVRAFYTTVIRKMFAKFPFDGEVLKDLVVMDLSKRADITYAPSKFLSINTNGKIGPCCTVNESTKCVLIPFICHHYQSVSVFLTICEWYVFSCAPCWEVRPRGWSGVPQRGVWGPATHGGRRHRHGDGRSASLSRRHLGRRPEREDSHRRRQVFHLGKGHGTDTQPATQQRGLRANVLNGPQDPYRGEEVTSRGYYHGVPAV